MLIEKKTWLDSFVIEGTLAAKVWRLTADFFRQSKFRLVQNIAYNEHR